MIPTDEKNNEIFDTCAEFKLHPRRIDVGFLAFSRDEAHVAFSELQEWDIIKEIETLMKEIVGDNYHVFLSGKTDDDWFCEIRKRQKLS